MAGLPFDKQSLLAFIQSLPDEISVGPFEMSSSAESDLSFDVGRWEAADYGNMLRGGRHVRGVENSLTFRLSFRTREEGYFKRTLELPEGEWRDIKRINLDS